MFEQFSFSEKVHFVGEWKREKTWRLYVFYVRFAYAINIEEQKTETPLQQSEIIHVG